LGDKVHDFSLETTNRIRSFGMKLERKRNYEKFTMPTTDCGEIMIICNCLVSFSIANTICCFSYSEVIKYILNRVRSNNVEFTINAMYGRFKDNSQLEVSFFHIFEVIHCDTLYSDGFLR
jgi:hypothetical protein